MLSRKRFYDWILLLVCNLIWASQFAMVKLVQEQMGPLFAVFFPMATKPNVANPGSLTVNILLRH